MRGAESFVPYVVREEIRDSGRCLSLIRLGARYYAKAGRVGKVEACTTADQAAPNRYLTHFLMRYYAGCSRGSPLSWAARARVLS